MKNPTTGVLCRYLKLVPALSFLLLPLWSSPAATVIWRAPNANVYLGLPFASLEFQNPLSGVETVLGHDVLEWRDADYTAGNPPSYGGWTVSPAGIDGNLNEIWLRATGHVAQTTMTVPADTVSIHLNGDNNDGIAAVYVDGKLVARLDMNMQSAFMQTALVLVRDLPAAAHAVMVRDESTGALDDVAILGAAALKNELKWQQPPVATNLNNLFYGWNETSVTNRAPLAADDWVCTSPNPVTRIRWWGSFQNWTSNTPPAFLPNAFQITVWTDVPANPTQPGSFSHPGTAIWQVHTLRMAPPKFVGYDYDPQTGQYEACFLFEQDLEEKDWFYQQPGPTGTNIYWLSIAGEYWQGTASPWPWGWKTRPRNPASPAPDAAVRIGSPPPWTIVPGMHYINGSPIRWPDAADPKDDWDLAFELVSSFSTGASKWEQLPDLSQNGLDVKNSTFPPPPVLLADDFLCRSSGPITNVTIWGSWLHDIAPKGGSNVAFTLSIHKDIPAGQVPWSMPGETLKFWHFPPGTYRVSVEAFGLEEGWFEPPGIILPPGSDTVCYRYEFDFPLNEAFVQQGAPQQALIYWLDCQAQPIPEPGLPEPQFGWKTSVTNWNDTAVWCNGSEPYTGPWERILADDRFRGLAFRINSSGQAVSEVKWSQPPEPFQAANNFNGWNEPSRLNASPIAADDWVCTDARPISDIHFWGSFLGWDVPSLPETGFNAPLGFQFTIWTDVPAQPGGTAWSHPGVALWQYETSNYSLSFTGWDWDPRYPGSGPEACFKFHVDVLPEFWFYQDPGTSRNIYWLSIAAVYPAGTVIQYPWGWKTRPRDPNSPAPDDAVRIFVPVNPGVGSQFEQGAPIEFPAGASWDMAFELTAGPEPPKVDWGDAPRPYPTQSAANGAVHTIVAGLLMGGAIDAEPDGQPDPAALGDDNNPATGPDDEDGVALGLPFFAGQSAAVVVQASSANLYLNAWYDFGADGSWAQSGDQIFTNVALAAGANALTFLVPPGAPATNSFARFRVSTALNLGPTGPAPDGEVEDYQARVERLDFGDAPVSYGTLLAQDGARHIIGPMFLGLNIDSELDGQPGGNADLDDLTPPPPFGVDDEDGVLFQTALISGVPNMVTVRTSMGGYLQAWIDANGDGSWSAVEKVITDRAVGPGLNSVSFLVPALNPALTKTYMRFRLSGVLGLGAKGLAPDGEVEDYLVEIQPLKWLQRPELGWEGVDVENRRAQLADDFRCTQSGPITDFHIWGSFLSDVLPPLGPGSMTIALFLYSDVPAGTGNPFSHPGELLWSRVFAPGQYTAGQAFHQPDGEWWHDPVTPGWQPNADKNIYQFDFYLDPTNAFHQVEGTVYWLGVKYATSPNETFRFGWKTTYEPWNDSACYLNPDSVPLQWQMLRYAAVHPYNTNSLNLAFAVSGQAGEVLDFGDAPDSPTALGYPTLLINNGARHTIVPSLRLGGLIDSEANGQPNATATGDDLAGMSDEDGVVLPVLVPGQPATLQVVVVGTGWLNGWIDFGADNSWAQAGDQVFTNVMLSTGTYSLNIVVPNTAPWGATTFARFRFSTRTNLTYLGAAPDGEVEDYLVKLESLPNSDLGDAPDSSNHAGANMTAYPKDGPPGIIAKFPTVYQGLMPRGPIHWNARTVTLGASSSGENEADIGVDQDGLNNISPVADKSDLDGADDGLLPPVLLPHCGMGSVTVKITQHAPGPSIMYLNIWLDWNRDGDWDDVLTCPDGSSAPEWAGRNVPVSSASPIITVPIKSWHPSLKTEPVWMRITLAEQQWPGPAGFGGSGGDGPAGGYELGETEDYYLTDYEYEQKFDFGDAPQAYPTVLGQNGARHLVVSNFMLGAAIDAEPDGLPHWLALGDDLNNLADEDGVQVVSPLVAGRPVALNVTLNSSGSGKLDAWLDLNRNGSWETTEQIFTSTALLPGVNNLSFILTNTVKLGTNYARFRLSSTGGLSPAGASQDGEVEDYQVVVRQRGPGTNIVITWIGVTNLTATSQLVSVQWNAQTNVHYELLSSPVMGSNLTWQVISPEIIGPANTFTYTNSPATQHYYRVRAPWIAP